MEANFKTCLWHQSFFTSSFAAPMAVPDEDGAVKALLPRLLEEFGQDWGKNLEYQWVYTALGLNRGRKFPSASVRSLTNVLVDKLQEQYPGTSWEDVVLKKAMPRPIPFYLACLPLHLKEGEMSFLDTSLRLS